MTKLNFFFYPVEDEIRFNDEINRIQHDKGEGILVCLGDRDSI